MSLSSRVKQEAFRHLLWNPTRQTMGHNQPSSECKNYFNLDETYPDPITDMFEEELQKELGECILPTKNSDVNSNYFLISIYDVYKR